MAVNLHSTHYRFGIDELAENTHGWHAAEDVSPAQGAIAVDTTFLLRVTIQETGGTAAANTDVQFRCKKNAGAFQNITTTSSICKAVAATALTDAAACTKRLSGTGTFETSGAGQTEDGLSGGAPNDIAASGNSETECGLQIVGADVVAGDVITFAWTSPDFTITNDVVPTVTVAGATIVDADGASAGIGASSVLMASVIGGATASAGLAASAVVAAALWVGIAAAAGVGTPEAVTGAVAAVDGASAGVGTASGTATNTEAVDGASAGVGAATGVMAAYAGAAGASAGVAVADGLMAIVSAADGASTSGGSSLVIIND